jgi:hypothetical protein
VIIFPVLVLCTKNLATLQHKEARILTETSDYIFQVAFSMLGCPTSTVYGNFTTEGDIDIW